MVVRVKRIFPHLIGDAVRRGPANPEVTAANRVVHAAYDPLQRREQTIADGDCPPTPVGERFVEEVGPEASAIGAEQVYPLRRGVDRAEVREIPADGGESNGVRIVGCAELVQDAARLFLAA